MRAENKTEQRPGHTVSLPSTKVPQYTGGLLLPAAAELWGRPEAEADLSGTATKRQRLLKKIP